MEKLVIVIIGILALVYVVYMLWRNLSGKAGCNCANKGSCCSTNNCCAAHHLKKSEQ
ncbi:MAG: hypothetical protein H6Q74_1471 [Firmicutes bacterium]|nr:hypothetical protein [Bacillota bacterium]